MNILTGGLTWLFFHAKAVDVIGSKYFLVGVLFLGASLVVATDCAGSGTIPVYTLAECVDLAMDQNYRRPASRFAVAVAEARHQQALSAYWPQVSLQGSYELLDESSNFVFPGRTFSVPSLTLGPGMNLAIPDIPISDQDVTLQDEKSVYASMEANWLLWDGGMRKGMREQSAAGIDAARVEERRTDLEVVDSVTRLYYGAVVAGQLHQLGKDTLARMDASLSLTKSLYECGSGTVRKTDYLGTKMVVETLRSAVAMLEKNETMSQAALAYTIGLGWQDSVKPVAEELPFTPLTMGLNELVSDAYVFNPDWELLDAGLRAAEGALGEARSGHYPKLVLSGEVHKWWNDYDQGYATAENKEGWSAMAGMQIPLFKGFLTRGKVKEAHARLNKLKSERFLLREGVGMQVRDVFVGLDAASKQYEATLDAMNTAVENCELNTRAYQNDLVSTEDVVRAQLMEAFMSAQHYRICYEHMALRSRLNLVVGSAVLDTFSAQ